MQKIRSSKKKTCPAKFAKLATGHLPGEKNGSGIGIKFYFAVTNANKKRTPRYSFRTPAFWLCILFVPLLG
jgi:hypothetical protein